MLASVVFKIQTHLVARFMGLNHLYAEVQGFNPFWPTCHLIDTHLIDTHLIALLILHQSLSNYLEKCPHVFLLSGTKKQKSNTVKMF